MPVSRRRRKQPRSSQLKGLLRGSNRSEATLTIARAAANIANAEAARWAVMHLQVKGPLQRLRPRKMKDMYTGTALDALSLDKELVWASEIILRNLRSISSFLYYKTAIETALSADEAEVTISLLDELEENEGFSLFSISTRIAILQLYVGLEAQKEYLAKIRSQNASPNIQFFCYWWSVRCEESSSWVNFEKEFSSRLKRWSLPDSFRSHIGFEVLRRFPVNGEEASLICGSYLSTAFDVYQTVIAVAELCLIEDRSNFAVFVPLLELLSKLVPDPRITKLLFLANENFSLGRLRLPDLSWRNALVQAEPVTPDSMPSSLEEIRAASIIGYNFDNKHPFARRISEAFCYEKRPEETTRSRSTLVKLGAMFDHLSIGNWLSALAADPDRLDTVASEFAAKRRFVHTDCLDPEVIWKLETSHQKALRKMLPASTDNPYLEWIDKLAQRAAGGSSGLLSRAAELELDLTAAFASKTHQAMIDFANEYEKEVGRHSYLSLNALVRGELGLRGVASAACFLVDRLLENPHYAAWLPIEELASRAMQEQVDAKAIDIPILLHFAAQRSSDPFSSERTYAVEDYLAAHGALRPRDLIETIARPHATSKEIFFFRECCAVSSMRISTLFQNETELEEERIAICQWLIEEECDQAEILAEEVRELVRGRLVRQGLRELEGNKLSIDSAGLRAWADRALREDYNRYMDLLKSGLFVVDLAFKEAVLSAIESADPANSSLVIPENEGASLLGSIVTRAIREFALHSEHGLDAYLSLRIRHGTISGHLRGPIEELNIITRRRTDGSYLPNEHWIDRLGGSLPRESILDIDRRLSRLSSEYDELIERLTKELIQVRTTDKPKGLIPVEVSSGVLAVILTETIPGVSFGDFMVRCEDIFWVIVSSGSGPIRAAIDDIASEIHHIFDGAEEHLRQFGEDSTAQLRDSLVRGKGIALTQLEKIHDWLQPPTTQGSIGLDVEALVKVSLAVIQGFYNTFQPKISVSSNSILQLRGAVRWFSDVFFILFENVMKYSGNAIDPEVKITIDEEPEHLSFKVTNSVDVMTQDRIERIERARERIQNGSFRTAVRSEGGTGLPKLAKVIAFGNGGELDFQYNKAESIFEVHFKVRIIEVAGGRDHG
ncbi:MAG: hypothetical protein PBV01_24270 [Brucella anthropi]